MRPTAYGFHSGGGAGRSNYVEPRADRAAPLCIGTDPRNRQILTRPLGCVGSAAENALLVFVHLHHDRLIALAANDFFAPLIIKPAVAPPVLPTGRAAGAAVFDEEVARIGVHVR